MNSVRIKEQPLDKHKVMSSVSRGINIKAAAGAMPSDKGAAGMVELLMDATKNFSKPLTKDRLFQWKRLLNMEGETTKDISVSGGWRNDKKGPARVISRSSGKEHIHFQAPDAERLENEIDYFLKWFNTKEGMDPVLKAGVAHLWFVTIHPFDHDNGRIARAITDMQLAVSVNSSQKFCSMTTQLLSERGEYYHMLETTQKGSLDITSWLEWFLNCYARALQASEQKLESVTQKSKLSGKYAEVNLNSRQRAMIKMLYTGFEGKLTTSKWGEINNCSSDTALRDIQDLLKKKILERDPAVGGRSTNYRLLLT